MLAAIRFGPVLIGIGKSSHPKFCLRATSPNRGAAAVRAVYFAKPAMLFMSIFFVQTRRIKGRPRRRIFRAGAQRAFYPPPLHFTAAPAAGLPRSRAKAAWRTVPMGGMPDQPCINSWAGGTPPIQAVMCPAAQRGDVLHNLLAVWFSADRRAEYRNRLFHLKTAL